MRLKSIEIQGFKSFAEKVKIELSDGITAIVGPNGSGKSNVADAIRWVLGEQSARVLRGNRMEDVIFNGSQSRKPLSFAQVDLVFDNEDGTIQLPHSEVCVSRRVYRSGESEYLINLKPCRMKDIQELFYDTGVGKEGYSIIGQGKIEEILSTKGEERRAALEEAAGVMKYKARKEEAQRKLNNVAQSMVRVQDIMLEIESNLEPLKIQSDQAKEFIQLREELKHLEINLFIEQYERNRAKVERLQQTILELKEGEEKSRQREAALKEQETVDQEKTQLLDQLIGRAHEKEVQMASSSQQISGELGLAEQRKGFIEQETQRLQEEISRAKQVKTELLEALNHQAELPENAIVLLSEQAEAAEDELNAWTKQVEDLEMQLDELKQQWMDSINAQSENKSNLARMDAMLGQAQLRMEEIEKKQQEMEEGIASFAQECQTVKMAHETLLNRRNSLQNEMVFAQNQAQSAQQAVKDKLKTVQEADVKLRAAQHRLKVQEELKRDFEGYANSVKNLMRDIKQQQLPVTVFGTVGELVDVPRTYEKAIEQALGGGLQNIVVEREEDAKALIAHLRKNRYGRVTFLPVTALRPRTLSKQELDQLRGQGVLGSAVSLIGFEESVRPAVEYLLGRTVVVENLDAGIALCRKNRFSFRCVTLEGDILNASGPITGGSTRETNLISRDRVIEELKNTVISLQKESEDATAAAKQQETLAQRAQEDAQQAQKELFACASEIAVSSERLDATEHQAAQARQDYDVLMDQKEQVSAMISDLERELALRNGSIEIDEDAVKQQIAQMSEQLSIKKKEREERLEKANTLKMELFSVQSEATALRNDAQRAKKEIARQDQEIETKQSRLQDLQEEFQALTADLEKIAQNQSAAQEQMRENQSAIDKLETDREGLMAKVRASSFEREQLQSSISDSIERRYKMSAQMERLDADFENLQNRIWADYEISYQNAQELRTEIKVNAAMQRVNEIRETIKQMEYVNPGAIEEYERMSSRYAFLSTQMQDLEEAKANLEELIADLMAQMKVQFLEQFDIINQNFQRIFGKLFGGGQAELILTDREHAMDCAIDIVAQPPGKKLQLITLLSGGERALTAIAILFALLELKATPFCILDEIETSLDEGNLDLFAAYLAEYSSKTQFIVITHRRQSMEVASAMYGISMQEKGISKLVSVKFQGQGENAYAG